MQLRAFGSTGVAVSPITFGAMRIVGDGPGGSVVRAAACARAGRHRDRHGAQLRRERGDRRSHAARMARHPAVAGHQGQAARRVELARRRADRRTVHASQHHRVGRDEPDDARRGLHRLSPAPSVVLPLEPRRRVARDVPHAAPPGQDPLLRRQRPGSRTRRGIEGRRRSPRGRRATGAQRVRVATVRERRAAGRGPRRGRDRALHLRPLGGAGRRGHARVPGPRRQARPRVAGDRHRVPGTHREAVGRRPRRTA